MPSPLHLDVDHSHLFPGARLTCSKGAPPAQGRPAESIVRFKGGSDAEATLDVLQASTGRYLLDVGPYGTAAGTDIPAKAWIAALTDDAGESWTLLVKAKAD